MGHFDVHASADGHGKRIVAGRKGEAVVATDVCVSEKYLTERSHSFRVTIGYSGAEKISRKRSVDSGAKNIIGAVSANVGDGAQPMCCVVSNRCAAAIHIEAVDSRSGGIRADIGISSGKIKFRHVLRVSSRTE